MQALIKEKKKETFERKAIRKYGKTKRALENYREVEFTRQKSSDNKHMPQYEKRVDFFSQDTRKHF